MKLIPLIFALLIVLCQLTPAFATGSKEVTVENTTKLEVKEASKENIDFDNFTIESVGTVTIKSKDISLRADKEGNGIRISSEYLDYTPVEESENTVDVGNIQKFDKALSQNEINNLATATDSHDILVSVADIQNFNGHSVRITHFTDDGIQDNEYIQEVTDQDGYIILPGVEFSSIIVDGFTGKKSETSYNVNVTDYESEVTENASMFTITLGGVDDGVAIEEGNLSTYPDYTNMVFGLDANGSAVDITGNYNTSVSGAVLSTNRNNATGNSYYFDGVDDYIVSDEDVDFPNKFIISAWIKPLSYGEFNVGRIYEHADSFLFLDNTYHANSLSLINRFSITDGQWYTPVDSINISEWIHVVVEYDSSSIDNDPVIIINGIEQVITERNAPAGTAYDTESVLYIGNRAANDRTFHGNIDDFYVYNEKATVGAGVSYYTGYDGTSAKLGENGEWEPVINGQVRFENVTAGETVYILSADESVIATSLTKLYEYTQDYTLIEESETADNVIVQINATAGANMSESQLVYDVASLNFTYNMSISSDNSNVNGTYHNRAVTLDTGYLNAGDSFNYSLIFDKLTYPFIYNVTWTSKTSTSAAFNYSSNNSNVEQDIYLSNMSSGTYDLKYSNGTILMNATVANGWLKFEDAGGPTDTYKMVDGAYLIEKQTSATTFIGAIFVGLSFVGIYFANRFRRRNA